MAWQERKQHFANSPLVHILSISQGQEFLQLSREHARALTGYLTGHESLKKHLHTLNIWEHYPLQVLRTRGGILSSCAVPVRCSNIHSTYTSMFPVFGAELNE